MAYEIIGETVKSATSLKLGQIFDNPTRYKENINNPRYPSFWIIQVTQNVTPAGVGNNRMQIDYLINFQYRVAENIENVSNLRQQLDAVGLKLCTELTELDLELPTKTKNRYYEIVDGVCQMFFNITLYAIPETEEETKMEVLDLEENIIIEEE